MKTMTSSEARQGFSSMLSMLSIVAVEPVSISKKNKEVAVMISSDRYKELKKLEDILYGKAAELAIREGFASDQESKDLLGSI